MTGTFSIQRQKRVLWNQEIGIKLFLYKLTKSSYNLSIFYLNLVLHSNLNYLTYEKSSWKDIGSFRKRFRVQVAKIFLKVFIKTGVKEISPSFYLMLPIQTAWFLLSSKYGHIVEKQQQSFSKYSLSILF